MAASNRENYLRKYNALRKIRNQINRAVPGSAVYSAGKVKPASTEDRGFNWNIGWIPLPPTDDGQIFGYAWVSVQYGDTRYFYSDSLTAKNPHGRARDGIKMILGLEQQARLELTAA